MKISLNWLKQLTPIELTTEELIEKINAQIAAIEDVVDMAPWYKGVVIGKIISAKDHPQADKLGVYSVDIGSDVTVQVCAGDKELKAGDKVAYLAPGTTVPVSLRDGDPFVLEKRMLRGEESNGMLGSAKELAIGDDHEKVLRLDTDAEPGESFADVYELNDTIIDVENKALTHRPDTFGVIGFARELAGIQNIQFDNPAWFNAEITYEGNAGELSLQVENHVPELVPRFTAVALSGVSIKPSPLLLQSYLYRVGIRPINNVVDITNYMMVLTGQPLHAYDYDKVAELSDGEPKLIVRMNQEDQELTLLDGRTITPRPEALMVCTERAPIGLGGAMGGAQTEVNEHTTKIILEAATWNLYSIRRTSMEHGVTSEAVTRYIRGQEPEQDLPVLLQAATMLEEYAGSSVASSVIDNFPGKSDQIVVNISAQRVNSLLGARMNVSEMQHVLQNVGFEVDVAENDLAVIVPWWRADIHIGEDIVEEVGRLIGYDKLGVRLPLRTVKAVSPTLLQSLKTTLRQSLKSAGANELLLYNFVSEDSFKKTKQQTVDVAYRIRNALRPELAYMRTSITPSLLDVVNPNIRAGFDEFAIYEIGKSHSKQEINEESLPFEREALALVFAADTKAAQSYAGAPYYQAVAYADFIFKEVHALDIAIEPIENNDPWWVHNLSEVYDKNRRAKFVSQGVVLGVIGEFAPHVRRNFKLPNFAAGFEIDLLALAHVARTFGEYVPLSKFPSTTQDITMQVARNTTHAAIRQTIVDALKSEDMYAVVIGLDDFIKEAADVRNITFRITLQHKHRTLTTKEVNALIDSVVQTLKTKFVAHRI